MQNDKKTVPLREQIRSYLDSLHFRILVPTTLIAIVSGAIMYLLINGALTNILKTRIVPTELKESTVHKSEQIDRIFENALHLGSFITKHPAVVSFLKNQSLQTIEPEELPASLSHCMAYVKHHHDLSVVYMVSSKTLEYYTNEGFLKKLDLSLPENEWYESTLHSKLGYEINIDSAVVGKLNLWYDGVVKDENGTYGLAGFGIDISNITQNINGTMFGKNTDVMVVDNNGIIRFKRGSNAYLDTGLDESPLFDASTLRKIKILIKKKTYGYGEFELNGVNRFFIINPLKNADMYVLLDFPKEAILKNYHSLTTIATLFPIALAFVAFTVAYYMIRTQIIAPINTISSALKTYTPEKGFSLKGFDDMPREFRFIGETFSSTTKLLEESYEELRQFNTSLEKMVEKKTHELKTSVEELNLRNHELETAKVAAQMAANSKSEFISGVSHELRTPLNAIINFTDMVIEDFDETLSDKELQKDAKEYLERVLKNSKHLLALINDILDYSKLEAGKTEYDISVFELNAFLRSIYASTESLMGEKKIDYNIGLPKNSVYIKADKRRLTQVILNLISNAMKFTESGFVIISAMVSNDKDTVTIDVKDSGRGIEKSMQDKIFIPFSQVNKNDKGTGLGLGIAKRFCNDMGMDIKVVSEPGNGSTFSISTKITQKET